MSAAARKRLDEIPTIVLDHPTVESSIRPTSRFTTAVYGIHLPGTAYRMDEVPIPLRAVLPAKYLGDAEVLRLIEQKVAARFLTPGRCETDGLA
jgi:formylmethanofuran dehydrogenase subunit B